MNFNCAFIFNEITIKFNSFIACIVTKASFLEIGWLLAQDRSLRIVPYRDLTNNDKSRISI